MPKKEVVEDKIKNLITKLTTTNKLEKISMTKEQHEVMESLVVVYMIVASTGGDLKSIATLDEIWDSIIKIT
jgi:hypothetical protein